MQALCSLFLPLIGHSILLYIVVEVVLCLLKISSTSLFWFIFLPRLWPWLCYYILVTPIMVAVVISFDFIFVSFFFFFFLHYYYYYYYYYNRCELDLLILARDFCCYGRHYDIADWFPHWPVPVLCCCVTGGCWDLQGVRDKLGRIRLFDEVGIRSFATLGPQRRPALLLGTKITNLLCSEHRRRSFLVQYFPTGWILTVIIHLLAIRHRWSALLPLSM